MAVWDQQDGESDDLYVRFRHFLDQGPKRTLVDTWRATVQRETKGNQRKEKRKLNAEAEPQQDFYNDVKRWKWKQRADAWDLFQLDEVRRQRAEELETARRRHGEIARLMYEKAVENLQSLSASGMPFDVIKEWIDLGSKLQKEALTDLQLSSFKELADKIAHARKCADQQARTDDTHGGTAEGIRPD